MTQKKIKLLKNFNDIDAAYQKMDLHIHSDWTDGKDLVEAIVKQAESLNLNTIAITDHIRSTSTYFSKYMEKIQKVRTMTNLNILIGFETRIKNFQGELDVCPKVQNLADIRIASVHRFPFANKLFPASEFNKEIAQAIELELCLAALERGGFDILGHSGGMCLKQFGEFSLEYFEAIIKECKQNNIAFEINSSYHQNIYPQIKGLLGKHNPLVTFGSDAHDKKNIAKWLFDKEFTYEKN